jgi:putative ABC transport system permease protein
MRLIALKMLMGDRAKFVGILVGITFASLLITQQSAIYTGLMTRTYGFLTDTGEPDVWVMDDTVLHVDDIKPMADKELWRVRGVEGVDWAAPMYKGVLRATLPGGDQQQIWLVGLDDATLLGAPPDMIEGRVEDLRESDAIIVDMTEGNKKLLKPTPEGVVPVGVGDLIEINDHRAVIVGLTENSLSFQAQPTVYTTYSRALQMAPSTRRMMSYVLVKAREGEDAEALAARISELNGLKAMTRDQFADYTYDYYFYQTGIPVNFGIAVLLGFIVGTAIAGQTFYLFTLDNLKYFGTFKAMGASNLMILRMILLQAAVVGAIGYGLGVGAASLFGLLMEGTDLSFKLEWSLLGFTAGAVVLICLSSAALSVRKVVRLEPAVVFRE